MKVTILGTGTFFVTKERSAQSYLLEVDDKKILIDCGPGTLAQLSRLGVAVDDLDYIFVSHFHADHTADLFPLQMNFRLKEFFGSGGDYKTPTIYGPPGIEEFTKKLSYIYQLPAFDNYQKIQYLPYGSESISLGSLAVTAFKVLHTAFGVQADAFALRFESKGKVFVYSGDTVKCEGITEACQDADVFICDTSYAKGDGSPAHMDTTDIGEIAKAGRVKKVILTHFYPTTDEIDLVSEVNEVFTGSVERGIDLETYDV